MGAVSSVWTDATDASRSAAMVFQTVDSASALTERMRISSNGNVGIGAGNTPTAKLHVGGTPGTDGIRFPDGTLQTTAATASTGFPDYTAGTSVTYNTVTQATTSGYLVIVFTGSFMNSLRVLVGPTSSPATVIALFGDDINGNTKAGSVMLPIPAGMYYKVETTTVGSSGAWPYETVTSTFYPVL